MLIFLPTMPSFSLLRLPCSSLFVALKVFPPFGLLPFSSPIPTFPPPPHLQLLIPRLNKKKNIFLSTHSLGIRLFPLLLQALSSSSSPPSPSLVVPPMLADKVTVVILSIFKHILQETQHQIIPGSHGNKGKPLALGHQ